MKPEIIPEKDSKLKADFPSSLTQHMFVNSSLTGSSKEYRGCGHLNTNRQLRAKAKVPKREKKIVRENNNKHEDKDKG
jgi:hypothetical protein